MNDLPTSASPGSNPTNTNPPVGGSTNFASPARGQTQTGITPNVASSKEKEGIALGTLETGLRDVSGVEMELPKEVSAVGVKIKPTAIALPPKVSQLGVKPAGPNVPLGTGATVTLPLTDDQIAVGLHQSFTSSWRWLAQWCRRRLLQLHVVLKRVRGSLVRVRQ